ncbi:MAG: hopanoid biosynthesis-associated protein HpnK [Verrucomicrobia bacterium]|nr:hopanoid biosynthesis-associated protein HpnK [Verrucomicrobiota bacterium]
MASPDAPRRLVVNADDFGRSRSINGAVIRAHREGILTTASLMVNGEAFDEAVALAKQTPTLGVGLHITLVVGTSTLPAAEIPGLVNTRGEFSNDPVKTGFRYFFNSTLRPQLEREIAAQFSKFRQTGLTLDHVNGHLNLHQHPRIFAILRDHAHEWGVTHMRLTSDPFWLNARLAGGAWFYRVLHAVIFNSLSRCSRGALRARGIRHTRRVFGLLQNARVVEEFVLKLLPVLPAGDSELYSHPSLDEFKSEFDALVSPRVKTLVESQKIRLIRYQDL